MNNHASLNRHYRLVWSDHQQAYVVAAENARGRGKSTVSSLGGAVFAGLLALSGSNAAATPPTPTQLPTGGAVVAGAAVITQSGARMDVNQASQKAIVEWGTFNIGAQAQVNFNQPSASSVALNRVLDSNPSQIYGHLNATGQVFFVNPNGMYFAPGASVDVGGLVASTHRLSNADFMAGNYRFTRDGATGSIVNEGNLRASMGGYIALLAPEVRNQGVIVAQAGTVAMAAGEAITLNFAADSLASVSVDPATIKALVENKHAVLAPGGRIILSAHAADRLQGGVVKNSGTLEASGIVNNGGEVFLKASDGIEHSGTIRADAAAGSAGTGGTVILLADLDKDSVTNVSGALSARAGDAGGNGGFIETSGSVVNVSDSAVIDTRAPKGATGDWLIDPYNITVAASGGNITGAALATALGSNNVTLDTTNATATGATYSAAPSPSTNPGNITVDDAITKTGASHTTLTLKAHNDITINSAISSTGGRLNVALTADQDNSNGTTGGGDVIFGGTGSVTTNSGNFYVGSVVNGTNYYADAVTATAANFTMGAGSFVDVGSGLVNIKITNTATLTGDATRSGLRVADYTKYAYNIAGTETYNSNNHTENRTSSSVAINAASVLTNNTDPTRPDIVTAGDTYINGSAAIGASGAGNAIKLSGAIADAANNRVNNRFRDLQLINSAGSTYVSQFGNQVFGRVSLSTSSQTNTTHNIQIMNDAGGDGSTGTGHIIATIDGAGLMNIASGGINTSGNPGTSNYAPSSTTVFPTSVTLINTNIAFANNAVNTGLTASGTTGTFYASGVLTGTPGGGEDIKSQTVSLTGSGLGTAANPVELGAGNTLTVTNSGGGTASTYIRVLDDTYSTITLNTSKTAGTHEILFSGGDHINFTTDGSKIIVPTLSARSNGTNFGVATGIDLSGASGGLGRDYTLTATTGDIQFDDNSVNTANKSFTATINSGTTGSIYSKNDYNSSATAKQITAGDVTFNLYSGNIGGGTKHIQIEKGGTSTANTLTVNTYTGAVNIHELTANHIKTVNMTLNSNPAAQTVAIDFNSTNDDINLSDASSLITLTTSNVKLADNNRNLYFSAPSRNVQIDGFVGGSGYYHVQTANTALKLNGDISTNDGGIGLVGSRIDLMKTVSVTNNSDHLGTLTNSNPNTGSGIYLQGDLSGTGNGYTLSLDSSSTDAAGSTIRVNSAAGNTGGGSYLGGMNITSKGSTNTNDGVIDLRGAAYNLKGNFAATGNTYFYNSNLVIDTEQGNLGSGGNITFAGQNLSNRSSTYSLNLNTSTTFAGGTGGNVDLAGTFSKGTITANSMTVDASGGVGGAAGTISLPAVSTIYSGTASTQTYTGSTINLYGSLSSNWGNITLTGSTVLQNSVTIDTWSATNTSANSTQQTRTAGAVTLNGSGVSAASAGKTLTIDTSTATGSGYFTGTTDWQHSGGTVSILAAGNAGGAYLDALTVTTLKGGTRNTATNGALTLNGAIQTTTAQTYTMGGMTIGGNLTSGTITFDTSATAGVTMAMADPLVISATNLLLRGSGTNYNFASTTAGHQVGTLAATGAGTLSFMDADALALGTVSTTNGLSASGTINIATLSGDLTIAQNITSTDTTTSAVTLNAGKTAAQGTTTGGNILVSGTPTVTVGTGGRATLFTGSVAGSTGLTTLLGSGSGRFRYNSDEAQTNYVTALGTGSYAIYREQPAITATVNNQTMNYGDAVPTLTFQLTGGVNGDTSAQAFSDQPTITIGGTRSTSNNYIVGTHNLTPAGGTSALGYGLTVSATPGVLTVNAKQLSATATASNKTYNGDTNATINTASKAITGAVTNDVVSLAAMSSTGTFASKNVANGISIDLTGLTLSGTDKDNYTVTGVGGASANITPFAVNLTGTRAYDATSNVAAGIFTMGTLVGTETLTLSGTGTVASKNVGNGKTVTLGSLALGNGNNGGVATNYTFTGGTQTASISQANLTLSTSNVSRVYNGTMAAAGTAVATAGTVVFTGDTISGGTFAFTNKDAGADNKTVTVSNVTVNDGNNGDNYNVTYASNTTSTISQYAVSMTGTRAYDGTANVAAGIFTMGTLVGTETLTLSGTGTVASKNVGNGKTVTLGSLALGNGNNGGVATNYTFTGGTQTASISQANLTLSTSNVSRVYNGNTDAAGTAVATAGMVFTGDSISGGTFAFTNKDAGTGNKTATVSNVTVNDGNNGANYNVTYASNTTSTISPFAVSMTGTRAYDGTSNVAAGIFTMGTLVGTETLTLSGTGTVASKNVGNGKTVTLGSLALGSGNNGGVATNYTFAGGTQTADITRYAVSLTGSRAYDGTVNVATGILTIGTLIGNETLTLSGSGTVDVKDVGTGKAINSVGLALVSGSNGGLIGNYVINDRTGVVAITTTPLLVTATNDSKTYNGIPYSGGNGVTYAGFVNSETSSVLGGTLAYTGTAQGAINVGEYVLTAGGYSSTNYAFSYVNGLLRITQEPVVLPPPVATTTQAVIEPAPLVPSVPGSVPPPSAVPPLPDSIVIVAPIVSGAAPELVTTTAPATTSASATPVTTAIEPVIAVSAAVPAVAGPTISLSGGFVAVVPVGAVAVPVGQGVQVVQLPAQIFSHSVSGTELVIGATLENGSPLPSWIKFDPSTSRLTVTPGQGDAGTLKIKVSAVDSKGGQAATVLELKVIGRP
jgi:filamentous hemagglutinin family protein